MLKICHPITDILKMKIEIAKARAALAGKDHRALDHALGGEHLGPADRRGCLDIDDDRVIDIDQIVGRVAEEGLPAVGACSLPYTWRPSSGRRRCQA